MKNQNSTYNLTNAPHFLRELDISTLELSKWLGISQPTASQSVKRGEKIVKEKQLEVLE